MKEHNHQHQHDQGKEPSRIKLAFSATLHCLLGCGIGEVLGIIIGTSLAMSNINTLILAVGLGFVFGIILGIRPLLKAGFKGTSINSFWNTNAGIFFRYKAPKMEFSIAK